MSSSSRVLHSYKRGQQGRVLSIVWSVAALGFAGAALTQTNAVGTVTDGVVAVVFLVLAVRAVRSCVVTQTEDRIVVRQTQWTYRLPKQSVRRFMVEAGAVRYFQRGRWFLVAELANGELRAFKEFNGPMTEASHQDLIEVVAALNTAWHLD
jgi:hypothetical protein